MGSENHDDSSPELLESSGGDIQEIRKQPRYSYTRDFLLSLSELDICKKLPAGFDASLLSEINDASSNSLQQHRSLGGYYSQSSRRNEYGYVQTNRLESSGNYSRGSQGKWETRSSGSSDREELQIDQDSSAQDIGKHNLNQPRRLWKQTEHDSLLGKPSGYSGQTSSQRYRGNGSYTLNKSSEPYQPPKPYKTASHSWRDNSDSVNDETFGSSECSEDRAEEERRRRASFELMRKEQQKALQEKQKQASNSQKGDVDTDPLASMKKSVDLLVLRSKTDDVNLAPSQSDSSKIIHTQPSASRPRIPPGFTSTTVVKNVAAPPSEMTFAPEAGKSGSHILPILTRDASVESGLHSSQETGSGTTEAVHSNDVTDPLSNAIEKVQASSSLVKSSDPPSYLASGPPQAADGWMDTAVDSDFTNNLDTKPVLNKPASQSNSTSILDKLFQNALKQTDGSLSNFAEDAVKTDDDAWSPSPVVSSKFSHWFSEEKTKPEEKDSQEDLLSQIFNNEKAVTRESMVPNEKSAESTVAVSPDVIPSEKVTETLSAALPFESNEASQKLSDFVRTPETCYSSGKKDTNPGVLTCKDLEQFILAEANATGASGSLPPQLDSLDAESEPSTGVNDYASQHLLSLLHVGTGSQHVTSSLNEQTSQNFNMFDGFDSRAAAGISFADNSTGGYTSKVHNVERSSTLEGLFGAAFMRELQSTDAPLSAQTDADNGGFTAVAAASHAHDLSFSHSANVVDGPASSLNKEYNYNSANEVSNSMLLNQVVHRRSVQDAWAGFQASKVDGFMADKLDNNAGHPEIQLPGEESLISVGETLNPLIPDTFSGSSVGNGEQLPLKSTDDISGKVATLNSIFGNERAPSLPGPDGSLPIHGSFDLADSDPPLQQLLGRQSSPLHQINQTGPPFQQLDPRDHRNRHAKFISPDGIHYDTQHQFPPNTILPQSLHNVGQQFDTPAHLAMMHNNMPVHGNFALHELHGYPRGAMPSRPTSRLPNMLDMNPMHGFPMAHRQPSHSGLGMEMAGLGMGVAGPNHPEALERLFEMEMRAAHQLAGDHPRGLYGPEVDRGFRYR